MKKILILIGPLFSYVICLVTGGFHLIVQFHGLCDCFLFSSMHRLCSDRHYDPHSIQNHSP